MADQVKFDPPGDVAQGALLADRRRPGRRDRVEDSLLPLLRGELGAPELDPPLVFDAPDQIGGMRGIAFGTLLSLPLWAAIYFAAEWIIH